MLNETINSLNQELDEMKYNKDPHKIIDLEAEINRLKDINKIINEDKDQMIKKNLSLIQKLNDCTEKMNKADKWK